MIVRLSRQSSTGSAHRVIIRLPENARASPTAQESWKTRHVGGTKIQVSPILLSLCRLLLLLKSLNPVRHIKVSGSPYLMNNLNRNRSVFRMMSELPSAWLFKMTLTACLLNTLFSSSVKPNVVFTSFKVLTVTVMCKQVHSNPMIHNYSVGLSSAYCVYMRV